MVVSVTRRFTYMDSRVECVTFVFCRCAVHLLKASWSIAYIYSASRRCRRPDGIRAPRPQQMADLHDSGRYKTQVPWMPDQPMSHQSATTHLTETIQFAGQ